MKICEKQNKLILSDRKNLSAKRNAQGAVVLVASLLALALIVGGSIFSFAMAVKESRKSDGESPSSYASKNAEIPEDKMQILGGYDALISEIDENIKNIDTEINQCRNSVSPEKKVYAKELYDKRAGLLLSKAMLCEQYSDICLGWAQETRDSLAEPIAEYEEVCEVYKERLSAVYEAGFPDFGDIFGTSDTIMDFVMGKVILDEVRNYDKELADEVAELYAVVEDGLAVVKYYLARSENYSDIKDACQKEFYTYSGESVRYLSEISGDRDTYNYLLQYYAECDQMFVKQLKDALSQNNDLSDGKTEYTYPVGSEYFYTDYIGHGHESRMEWSVALGEYVNVFHSGIDIHTALRYDQVKASADGKVIYADYCPSRGYTVALVHADGTVTVYSGCSLLDTKLGDDVKVGDTIAFSGMSEESSEFKVTFEVFNDGGFVDPESYIELPDLSLSGN